MGSAHQLSEVKFRPKSNEYPPRDKEVREQTLNLRVNPMTLNCDVDLDLA